jgi:hypothetical protein
LPYTKRWASLEKDAKKEPAAQIAHLVFANTQANQKNQKSYLFAIAPTEKN